MWLKIIDLETGGDLEMGWYELTKQAQFSHMSSLKLSFRESCDNSRRSKNVMAEDSTLSDFKDKDVTKVQGNHGSIISKMKEADIFLKLPEEMQS